MRSMEMSAKTVEAAVQAACEALGVDRDDINVSYEVLEFPTRKLFKTIPAKVLVKVEEPEAEKPAEVSTKPAEVVEISDETAPEIQKEVVEDMVEEAELAPVPGEEVEVPLDIDADPRLQAAVDYLTPIFNLMGVENFTFTAVKKGAATVLKVSGEHMGALIGRRGETMESLSYLASLVVNRMEGPYVKLALELSKRDTGRTLYILDEPTTGLHFADIDLLLKVLHQLRDAGNTIVVIEHNLDVIKTADWLIDMGPEGGSGGGQVVGVGTPEELAANPNSHTGRYLKRLLTR